MSERDMLIGAICDDMRHVHDAVQNLVDTYAKENGIACEMNHLYSAQELLDFEKEIDFLLLDIDMPEMDGFEAARILKIRHVNYKIIMLTGYTDRFKEAFKVGAFRYVTKPVSKSELFESLDGVRERMIGLQKVRVCRNGVSYEITQRDILYIMADSDVTKIFTDDFEYRSEQPLKRWLEILDDRMFFPCHRGYIVNLGKIEQIEKGMAVLITGEKVPVARRKKTELLKVFIDYDLRRR